MVSDAFHYADRKFGISDSVLDVDKFRLLTDSILERIIADGTQKESCDLIRRIYRRDLYRFVNQLIFPPSEKMKALEFFTQENIASLKSPNTELPTSAVCVVWKKLNFTMAEANPLSAIRFYNKGVFTEAFELPSTRMSLLLPEVFEEVSLRVFVKDEKYKYAAQIALKTAYNTYQSMYPGSRTQLLP